MTISLGEKPFIQWNPSPIAKQSKNHICMFGGSMTSGREHIQHSNALYFRFKQYSPLYHEYLMSTSKQKDEILPYGCIQLFVNNFHINEDLSFLPLLQCMLSNLYPVHFLLFRSCIDFNFILEFKTSDFNTYWLFYSGPIPGYCYGIYSTISIYNSSQSSFLICTLLLQFKLLWVPQNRTSNASVTVCWLVLSFACFFDSFSEHFF